MAGLAIAAAFATILASNPRASTTPDPAPNASTRDTAGVRIACERGSTDLFWTAFDSFERGIEGGEMVAPPSPDVLRGAFACAPFDGDLWLAAAWMAFATGDQDKALARLARSCASAPHVPWTARLRLRLFGGLEPIAPEGVRACLARDRRFASIGANRRPTPDPARRPPKGDPA